MEFRVLLVENNGGTTRRVLTEAGLSVTEVRTPAEMSAELQRGDYRMVVITLGVDRAVELETYRQAKLHKPALPLVAVSELALGAELPEDVTSVIHKSELTKDNIESQFERHVRKTLQLAIDETDAFFDVASSKRRVGG